MSLDDWFIRKPVADLDSSRNPIKLQHRHMLEIIEGHCRDKPHCWPGTAALAKQYGCLRRNAQLILKAMHDAGVILCVPRDSGRPGRIGIIVFQRSDPALPVADPRSIGRFVGALKDDRARADELRRMARDRRRGIRTLPIGEPPGDPAPRAQSIAPMAPPAHPEGAMDCAHDGRNPLRQNKDEGGNQDEVENQTLNAGVSRMDAEAPGPDQPGMPTSPGTAPESPVGRPRDSAGCSAPLGPGRPPGAGGDAPPPPAGEMGNGPGDGRGNPADDSTRVAKRRAMASNQIDRLRRRGLGIKPRADGGCDFPPLPGYVDPDPPTATEREALAQLWPEVLAILNPSPGDGRPAGPGDDPGRKPAPRVGADHERKCRRLAGLIDGHPDDGRTDGALADLLVCAFRDADAATSGENYRSLIRDARLGRHGLGMGIILEAFSRACGLRIANRGAAFIDAIKEGIGPVNWRRRGEERKGRRALPLAGGPAEGRAPSWPMP